MRPSFSPSTVRSNYIEGLALTERDLLVSDTNEYVRVRHGGWQCREGQNVTPFIRERGVTVTISSINLNIIVPSG